MPQKITIELEFEDGVEPLCYTKDEKINVERISELISELSRSMVSEIESGQSITLTKWQIDEQGDSEGTSTFECLISPFEYLFDYEPVGNSGDDADVLTVTITSTDT